MEKAVHKSNSTEIMQITYQGNNIVTVNNEVMVTDMSIKYTTNYTYDNKNNPFYQNCYSDVVSYASKNNVIYSNTKMYIDDIAYSEQSFSCSYTYDNNWPIEGLVTYEDVVYSTIIEYK